MTDGQVQVWGLRRLFGEVAIDLDCRLVIAEANESACPSDLEGAIRGIQPDQPFGLLEGPRILVPLIEHDRVFIACGVIVGRQHEHALEEELGVVEHLELHADPGQQAHPLDVIAVRHEKAADEGFGAEDVALGEQTRSIQHGRRKPGERLRLGRSGALGLPLARRAVERRERLPTREERGVQVHRSLVCRNRRVRLADIAVTVAALLKQAAVLGVERLKALESAERIGHPA
jgi:hypothetical protein